MKRSFLMVVLIALACGRTEKPEAVRVSNAPSLDTWPDQIALFIMPGRGLKPIYNILEGAKSNNQLLKLRTSGMLETNTFLGERPDDAAFLTSIFIGRTTYRGSMGMNKDSLPEKNLFEVAKEAGYFTAFLTPGLLADTLPCAMVGHHRYFNKDECALEFQKGAIDFFYGHGRPAFDRRKDRKNLFSALNLNGYQIALDSASGAGVKRGKAAIVKGYSTGEKNKEEFKQALGNFIRRNFSDQKVFMVVYFPPNLNYEERFEIETLAEFLSKTEFSNTLSICLSYPTIYDTKGDPNLRSSIGGVSSLLTFGPKRDVVMGLHSSTDFGNYIQKIMKGE